MEAKYYTPTLEEFHVGFEYENLRFDPEWKLACTWYSTNIANNRLLSEVFRNYEVGYLNDIDTKEPLYRVKCLCREDIESLGWKQVGYDNFSMELKDITLMLEFNPEYNTFIYRDCLPQENYFRGTIKNRSELRKLMQQLNIE